MATVPVEISAREATRLGYRSPQHAQRARDRRLAAHAKHKTRIERILRASWVEDEIQCDTMAQIRAALGVSWREQELSNELQDYCSLMAFRIACGNDLTYEDTFAAISDIAERHGFLSGVPVPLPGEEQPDLIVAEGVPLAEIFRMNQEKRQLQRAARARTEAAGELSLRNIPVRNSWHVLGDQTICVVETEGGPMALPRYDAGMRLRKFVRGIEVRHHAHQTAEAEFKAMDSLKKRISKQQFDTYVLSGAFPEFSKRSGLLYYFRKGLPTLAVSFHGKDNEIGKVLAALCLHPMGYYAGTHVGLMTPTDEVIAHLLMMRADEHAFWKKSGQWSATDSRSGV